jgi:type II secretory pathway component GspD/PulD (secretin)
MTRLLLSMLLVVAPALHSQETLEVITLRHRTAEQLIPILRPLVEPGGALSGQSNQLIVRGSAGNLAQIRSAAEAMDRPLRRLSIAVRFESTQEAARSGVQGDARISNRGSSADVRVLDSRSARDERIDQRIQVLEGGRALIAAGETQPLRQRQIVPTPSGPLLQESVVIQEAATGFEVVPRLSGEQVFLEIAPQREQFARPPAGSIRAEGLSTTVSGRLGEWIELGGTAGAETRSESGILSTRRSGTSGNRRVWVKVEELR